MKYKIVLVPFPFDDLSSTKVRPAICLTEKISNYNHIIVAFITSQIQKTNEQSDILIHKTGSGFEETGLLRSSAIRLHRLVTIPTNLIQRELGALPIHFQSEIKNKLKLLFEI